MVGIEKLLPTWRDLEVFLQLLPRSSTGERMNPYTSIWTGVTPGDGPQEVHIVLLDNGRTGALADQVGRQALRCIRCSACLNVCPVYERTGGHAYGSVYPGPIGAILTPQLTGIGADDADRLAALRLVAVRRLLRGLPGAHRHPGGAGAPARARSSSATARPRCRARSGRPCAPRPGRSPTPAPAGPRGSAWPGAAGRLVRVPGGRRAAGRLPGPASAWTAARDLPAPPRQSFRAWWATRRTEDG